MRIAPSRRWREALRKRKLEASVPLNQSLPENSMIIRPSEVGEIKSHAFRR